MRGTPDVVNEASQRPPARGVLTEEAQRPYRDGGGNVSSSKSHNPATGETEGRELKTQEEGEDIFVRERGVLWKRRPGGSFHDEPYCPSCKLPLHPFPPGSDDMLACPKCIFIALFRPSKSKEILDLLAASLHKQAVEKVIV
jgi:hypothetical protein